MELDLVSSIIIFLSQTTILWWFNFGQTDPWLWFSQSHSSRFIFFLLTLVFVLQWISLHWKILIMLLSQFPMTFLPTQSGVVFFIAQLIHEGHLVLTVLQWSFWRTDSEILYKLAECFNINLKQSCFSDCWKFLSVILVLKNFEEISAIKNYSSVIILFVVSNTLKITGLLINRLYYFEKCGLFSDFQYVMSSSSAVD